MLSMYFVPFTYMPMFIITGTSQFVWHRLGWSCFNGWCFWRTWTCYSGCYQQPFKLWAVWGFTHHHKSVVSIQLLWYRLVLDCTIICSQHAVTFSHIHSSNTNDHKQLQWCTYITKKSIITSCHKDHVLFFVVTTSRILRATPLLFSHFFWNRYIRHIQSVKSIQQHM